ncbi:hypothetical protein SKAU_G00116940 [Synaphobranchus kaupii]|uniref:Uncharacterized protein n=1 Tax=Synaphobranchus kaupii TaxID=118154 RepID=A0A9Q1FMY5_SYNKA|nr:hypothetical protein SKAU_G00116940 [Synaphobranchus kaupii]
MRVAWEWSSGHSGTWKSCPDIRGMPEADLLSAASIVLSGNTYTAHKAKYLTYSFMMDDTKEIIQTNFVQVTEATSSVASVEDSTNCFKTM